MNMTMTKKVRNKLDKIVRELDSLREQSKLRFAFCFLEMAKDLNSLNAEVVHNIQNDLASETLLQIIEDKIFENPNNITMSDVDEQKEVLAKIHMYSLFNNNKKIKA